MPAVVLSTTALVSLIDMAIKGRICYRTPLLLVYNQFTIEYEKVNCKPQWGRHDR